DRRGHLLGLAVADAHGAVAVAHDDQRGEAEPPAALHNLGHPVDRHDSLDEGGLLGRSVAAAPAVTLPAVAAAGAVAAETAGTPLGSGHQSFLLSRCRGLFKVSVTVSGPLRA